MSSALLTLPTSHIRFLVRGRLVCFGQPLSLMSSKRRAYSATGAGSSGSGYPSGWGSDAVACVLADWSASPCLDSPEEILELPKAPVQVPDVIEDLISEEETNVYLRAELNEIKTSTGTEHGQILAGLKELANKKMASLWHKIKSIEENMGDIRRVVKMVNFLYAWVKAAEAAGIFKLPDRRGHQPIQESYLPF